jgi:hypothetical protein
MDWSLNWNAIGAIAQAVAAIATFLAVLVALRLGKREDQRSLLARYDNARPILIIVSSQQNIPLQQGNDSYLDWNNQPPVIEVCNVGNGPALNVRSVIYGPEAIALADPSTTPGGFIWKHLSGEKGKEEREKHWYHWTTDVVSRGEQRKLQHTLAGAFSPIKFSEANKSVGSKSHKYAFNAPKQPLSSPNSGEPWHLCRVAITYHDIFHRKHASIYDLIFRQGWQAEALIDDIISDLDDLAE